MSLPADLVVLDLDFFPEHLLKLTHGVWCDGVPFEVHHFELGTARQ